MSNFILTIITFVGFQMLLALGMNVMWGFNGMLNLAYIVYYAFGAYVTATLMLPKAQPPQTSYILGLHLAFLPAAAIGLVASGLLAAVVGYVFLGRRLRPEYFPIVTLVAASAALQFVSQDQPLFNGFAGLISVPQPFGSSLSETTYNIVFVLVVFAVVAVVAAFCSVLRRSGLGRHMRAIREDELAASAYGINVFRTKLKAHVIGGVISAAAGILTIVYVGAFAPSGWSIGETIVALSCVFIGGSGNNLGAMVGAAIVVVVFNEGTQILLPLIPGLSSSSAVIAEAQPVALNLLVIVVLRWRQKGLIPEHVQELYPEPRPKRLSLV